MGQCDSTCIDALDDQAHVDIIKKRNTINKNVTVVRNSQKGREPRSTLSDSTTNKKLSNGIT